MRTPAFSSLIALPHQRNRVVGAHSAAEIAVDTQIAVNKGVIRDTLDGASRAQLSTRCYVPFMEGRAITSETPVFDNLRSLLNFALCPARHFPQNLIFQRKGSISIVFSKHIQRPFLFGNNAYGNTASFYVSIRRARCASFAGWRTLCPPSGA